MTSKPPIKIISDAKMAFDGLPVVPLGLALTLGADEPADVVAINATPSQVDAILDMGFMRIVGQVSPRPAVATLYSKDRFEDDVQIQIDERLRALGLPLDQMVLPVPLKDLATLH